MATKTDNPAEVGLHVFERSGLGTAPFRCVDVFEKFITHHDGSTQASGSCQHCGTGIRWCCVVRGADGREFIVGNSCVEKTGDRGLIQAFKTHPKVREAQRAARQRLDAAKIAEWDALWADPATEAAFDGDTFTDWKWGKAWGEKITFTITAREAWTRKWNMCGAAGRARTLKALKARLAK
jgi:hypothetical protein